MARQTIYSAAHKKQDSTFSYISRLKKIESYLYRWPIWSSSKDEAFAANRVSIGQLVWTQWRFEEKLSKMEWEKTNYGKKQRATYLFVSVSHPCNEKNIAKSMTILKLCERPFKRDLAGCPSSIGLEMALGWRQVVNNLEIYFVIFIAYLYSTIKVFFSWHHFEIKFEVFQFAHG